jgi:hypothetical protein
MPAQVHILLATYNGEAFLREQLDSLWAQSEQNFEVLAADDASSDGTVDILLAHAERHPGRLRLLFRDRVGSARSNFMRLLHASGAPYVMCCDQDDLWLPRKVEHQLTRIMDMEAEHGAGPLLVYSDLTVVDARLQPIADSFFRYQSLPDHVPDFRYFLLQNCVAGCASTANRALIDLVRDCDPDPMIMHDWWLALVASCFGRLGRMDEATVLYRQHQANDTGANEWNRARLLDNLLGSLFRQRRFRQLPDFERQARAFVDRYGDRLNRQQAEVTRVVAHLREHSAWLRKYLLVRHRLLQQGLSRNASRLLRL